MYFDNFADFLAMGRHGLYVWLSYGIFLAVILWNIWLVVASRTEALQLTNQAFRRADTKISQADTKTKNHTETEVEQ